MALGPASQRDQISLLGIVIAVAVVGAHVYFRYLPKREEFVQKEERISKLVAVNGRAKAELAKGNVNELRRQLAEYQQNLELVRTLVPTSNEVPSLLEQVSTAARRVGLDVASVDPQPVVEGEQYDTYRYNIVVVGGYHELAEFMANVGGLTRIVLPVNLALQTSANRPGKKTPSLAQIEAKLQLLTYVARKSPPPEVTLPKKAGAN
ncbi:MAG: type 4a pilus biogenesis protein PilO [Gemmatimonadota bacterium]|nr:type 4a pilus biogenesis protein PilO [Gemmatimonadota bacterium]